MSALPFTQIAPMLCPHCGAECEARRVSVEHIHIDEFRTVREAHSEAHICPVHGDVTDALVEKFEQGVRRFFGY